MTEQDLAAIKARADAATPPPWQAIITAETPSGPEWSVDAVHSTREDAEFQAHARDDVPRLLEEISRLRAMESRLKEIFGPAIPPVESMDWTTFDAMVPAEREACAKVAENHVPSGYNDFETAKEVAAAIRARGKQ